jgi:hypothetical protein
MAYSHPKEDTAYGTAEVDLGANIIGMHKVPGFDANAVICVVITVRMTTVIAVHGAAFLVMPV